MPVTLTSVVIPAYNEEQYLGRCLAALARQTYPADRFEVIVVDNGSTDTTAEIARRYGGVRVITKPRKGVARARQAGFAAARGAVIASTDADTVVPPFWVARIAEYFRADPALGAVYGPVYWPDGRQMEQLLVRYLITCVGQQPRPAQPLVGAATSPCAGRYSGRPAVFPSSGAQGPARTPTLRDGCVASRRCTSTRTWSCTPPPAACARVGPA